MLGTRAPFSPAIMFNVRARYDWTMQGGYNAYAWAGANHIGEQSNQPQSFPDGNDPSTEPADHDAAAVFDPGLHHL